MPNQVCMGATLMCSFGTAPSTMTVLPTNKVLACKMPAANIKDNIPMVNILPFAMCTSLANPQVASATSAALGVLTPMPCIPVVVAPWTPGNPQVQLGKMPIINNTSICNCTWGGVISITNAGQATVQD
jgi:hypothetical protein